MSASSLLTVFLPKPAHITYGEAMSRVRMWLDHRKIQPAGFRLAADGRIGFEIVFHGDHDATCFQREFNRPAA
jgi:hypothetical protein